LDVISFVSVINHEIHFKLFAYIFATTSYSGDYSIIRFPLNAIVFGAGITITVAAD